MLDFNNDKLYFNAIIFVDILFLIIFVFLSCYRTLWVNDEDFIVGKAIEVIDEVKRLL